MCWAPPGALEGAVRAAVLRVVLLLLFSSLPTLLLPVIVQHSESEGDYVLKFSGIFNLLILVIWTLRYFITEFLISEEFMNTIEKIF